MIRRMLRKERTSYGKELRKKYEAGEVWESRHKMTSYAIRPDEVSNTISTVLKDNLLIEIDSGDFQEKSGGAVRMGYDNTTSFKYIELFAGIGGFRQALDSSGGECVFASEIDKFAQQSYTALYGADHLHGDITQVDEKDVPDHDVLVGGFPCQAFSVAGKRLGFADETRGTLFFEIVRIMREKQPKIAVLENVKGLVGHDKGKTLDTVVIALNEIGYTVDFDVLNSKYFGVPQNRERIFIVAIRDDLVAPEPWRIEGTNVVAKGKRRIAEIDGVKTFNFQYPTQGEVTVRLRDILEDDVDERYYLSEEKTAKLVAALREKEIKILEDREDNDINAIYTPDIVKKNQNGRRIKPADDVMSALEVRSIHGVIEPRIEQFTQGDGVSCCVDASYAKGTAPGDVGKGRRTHVIEAKSCSTRTRAYAGIPETLEVRSDDVSNSITSVTKDALVIEKPRYRIRKLTPLECWRLQGFSDLAHETVKLAGVSDSQRYKQAGNAVTVNVIDALMPGLLTLITPSKREHTARVR